MPERGDVLRPGAEADHAELVQDRLQRGDDGVLALVGGSQKRGSERVDYLRTFWQEKDHNDKTRLNDVSLVVNANHPPATQFVTLAHELAHLYLGHLGIDRKRGVDERRWTFAASNRPRLDKW